jgi:uncharacterized membrane protein YqiK
MGDAEAGATQAKGEAEAEVLRKKAEAFKQYGEACGLGPTAAQRQAMRRTILERSVAASGLCIPIFL